MFGVNNDYADEMEKFFYLKQMSADWLKQHNFEGNWKDFIETGDTTGLEFLEIFAQLDTLEKEDAK